MDEIGRDYVILALAVGELEDGIVDAYYGPAELREIAIAGKWPARDLVGQAQSLRARVDSDEPDLQRRRWLDRQLVGLETIARRLDGEQMSYLDEVGRCFDARPEHTPREAYADLRTRLNQLLPAGPNLHDRLSARDERLTVPADKLGPTLDWVVGQVRAICAEHLPIPDGESLEVSLVTNEPWSAYNWYDGGLRSRVEFNTDLPTRAHQLVAILGHETFPGHHLEHAWKEQRLVNERGRIEASVQLINTPEAYISEGLAEVGPRLLVDRQRWEELLIELCARIGIAMTPHDAAREWEISESLRTLRGSGGDAALQLHAEGRSPGDVRQFLIDDALRTPEQADKSLQFITHPLWRTYVFCYAGGESLLSDWCAGAGDIEAQRARFFRLLSEQLTPSGIAEELATA